MSLQPESSWRASDADRQRVADVLTNAYAEGRLDREELDQRLEGTWSAKTYAELQPLTADLGATAQPAEAVYLPAMSTAQPPAVPDGVRIGVGPSTRERFSSFMSSEKHGAGTQLAAHTDTTTVMGEIKFDLRGGLLGAPNTQIEVSIIMGSLTIIVPEGIGVVDRTTKIMASTTVKGLRPHPDGPTITLTGLNVMGEVKLIGPDNWRYPKK